METNYIIILNYSAGEVIKIKLSKKQKLESEQYDDFGEYLGTLEEEYDFKLKDCLWMNADTYQERSFGF
jgi:hypothetical protein